MVARKAILNGIHVDLMGICVLYDHLLIKLMDLLLSGKEMWNNFLIQIMCKLNILNKSNIMHFKNTRNRIVTIELFVISYLII